MLVDTGRYREDVGRVCRMRVEFSLNSRAVHCHRIHVKPTKMFNEVGKFDIEISES